MPATYQVRVYSPTGVLQAVVGGLRGVTIEHRINVPSTCTLSIFAGDHSVPFFVLDALVEVRRAYPEAGLDWYTEFIGFHRTPQFQVSPADARIFTSYSVGLLDLVRRRSIRYFADTEGSAKGPAAADDVIKEYVRENVGSLATTANGRTNSGVTPGFTVAPDLGLAPSYEGADAWRNLLDAITDIGGPNRVDFEVAWLGGATFEFRTHHPQIGTNRTTGPNAFTFAIEQANMTNPSRTLSRTAEATSALVLGPGEGPLRDITLVVSPRVIDSPFNLVEEEYNASGEDREQALIDAGNKLLYEKRATMQVTFEPIQTAFSAYHKHYFPGDVVNFAFENTVIPIKINAVTINITESVEQLTLELEEESSDYEGIVVI